MTPRGSSVLPRGCPFLRCGRVAKEQHTSFPPRHHISAILTFVALWLHTTEFLLSQSPPPSPFLTLSVEPFPPSDSLPFFPPLSSSFGLFVMSISGLYYCLRRPTRFAAGFFPFLPFNICLLAIGYRLFFFLRFPFLRHSSPPPRARRPFIQFDRDAN